MKKIITVILASVLLSFSFLSVPTFAESEKEPCECLNSSGEVVGHGTKPPTIILGNSACDCGHGEAIKSIIRLVADIMTIGIGILGVIGISIVGVQYLTAGGNEEKTRKAKRRMFEIIIGLAAYVVIYAALRWLLPGFEG